ncbi:MAG: hypothetical protein SAJ12_08760 [Jaaginema sp. PMC 1079.18]|nr:hypothetical protein [Jaaginema sp. PMC 1080.18]MEC4851090.1 hypothetical protein [Jaaginema sp. PMC 1079.18]MEC4867038.1 hypothetical protein [Jaaginema sp. PMC 1078.18]
MTTTWVKYNAIVRRDRGLASSVTVLVTMQRLRGSRQSAIGSS